MKKVCFVILMLSSFAASAQIQQRSTLKGFNAAFQVHALGWTSDYFQYLDENAPSGIGAGLRVGYGITELIEPYIGFDFTSMGKSDIDAESFKMSHLDVGVRFNFAGTVHRVRPFAEGGYTYLKGTVTQVANNGGYVDLVMSGGKPHLGGGVGFFPKIPVSIFAKGLFTVGKKSSASIDGTDIPDKPDVTTFRISVGVNLNISELIKE
jgi:hypothetical protein